MSNKIKFKIITPEHTVFEDTVDQATLPVSDGEVTILPSHRPYIASLKPGEILLKIRGEETSLAVSGGFIEFNQDKLTILADTAERAEEIDLKRAEEARVRAEEIKREKISMDDGEYARVAAMIERALARIKVGKKHHTKRSIKID